VLRRNGLRSRLVGLGRHVLAGRPQRDVRVG
jgi:hypothetical protein